MMMMPNSSSGTRARSSYNKHSMLLVSSIQLLRYLQVVAPEVSKIQIYFKQLVYFYPSCQTFPPLLSTHPSSPASQTCTPDCILILVPGISTMPWICSSTQKHGVLLGFSLAFPPSTHPSPSQWVAKIYVIYRQMRKMTTSCVLSL